MKTRKRFMHGVRLLRPVPLARGQAGSRAFRAPPSLVLEMRIFTKESLEQELRDAGFSSIEFDRRECAEFGIVFPYQWNYPILARKIR